MIDLHCHILPGIDDGALDVADSTAMARAAAVDGVEAICATPHIRHDHDVRIGELPERLRVLNEALAAEGVPVEILPGGEVAETSAAGLSDAELDAVSLGGGGGWLLVEPAPGPLSDSLERVVAELAERGYGSLIAHPERHIAADVEQRLRRLAAAGALIQVTADALLSPHTAGTTADLAAAGLVHVVGSDAHSARFGRPAAVSRALARLAQIDLLRPHADWIGKRAPAAIVAGEPLSPPYRPVLPRRT